MTFTVEELLELAVADCSRDVGSVVRIASWPYEITVSATEQHLAQRLHDALTQLDTSNTAAVEWQKKWQAALAEVERLESVALSADRLVARTIELRARIGAAAAALRGEEK